MSEFAQAEDVDLKRLRYFLAVARHLNFGRAAEELHIAQPVLSRQIRVLEGELGAELFTRDRRGTTLTAAGTELVGAATELLQDARALRRRVALVAHGQDSFAVGFMPGLIVTDAVIALNGAHPDLNIEVLRTSWADQTDVLWDGRVDVSYVRLPVNARGLEVCPLFEEPRVAVLATAHPLATAASLELEDLAGEHLLQHPDVVPEWRAVASPGQVSAAERQADRVNHTVEEKLEHVATGRGIAVLPRSTALYYQRPDVTIIAVPELGPSEVALAWVAARRSALRDEFVTLALNAGAAIAVV